MMPEPPYTHDPSHFPVLRDEVIEVLRPKEGRKFVDGTFGAGGYTRALLFADKCHVWAIDRDPNVLETSKKFAETFPKRFNFLPGTFSKMDELVDEADVGLVDGVALDIGVSSMQLDQAERGFSFQKDGPLDMRMSVSGQSAADIVNEMEEEELANLIYQYGEERQSRRIAKAIVQARTEQPITRTVQLADIIASAVGFRKMVRGRKQIHPATRTFQGLRIFINDELGELIRGLRAAERILAPGGVLAVVTFHSLEDRIVKNFFKERAGELSSGSRHMPDRNANSTPPTFEMIFRGGKKPTAEEIKLNARSRSAKLRAGRRTEADAWPDEQETAA